MNKEPFADRSVEQHRPDNTSFRLLTVSSAAISNENLKSNVQENFHTWCL